MMPSARLKQKKFMDAAAHNPAFAQQAGVPQSVAQDFSEASKGMKFKGGSSSRPDLQRVNEKDTRHGKMELFKKGGNTMATKMNPGFMAMMAKKKADMGGMKKGGMSMAAFEKSGKDVEKKGMKEGSKADMALDKKQMMMKKGGATKKMASGGSASSRADGIASKGKTKGTNITMKRGGMAC
jgi:hypothetical protein